MPAILLNLLWKANFPGPNVCFPLPPVFRCYFPATLLFSDAVFPQPPCFPMLFSRYPPVFRCRFPATPFLSPLLSRCALFFPAVLPLLFPAAPVFPLRALFPGAPPHFRAAILLNFIYCIRMAAIRSLTWLTSEASRSINKA